MEKKYFYYNRFLGDVVCIKKWKYDTEKRIVHYLLDSNNEWETDLTPNDEPKFYDSKTQCYECSKEDLQNELMEYQECQEAGIRSFIDTINEVYDVLDMISWSIIREALGKDKCQLISAILQYENQEPVDKD